MMAEDVIRSLAVQEPSMMQAAPKGQPSCRNEALPGLRANLSTCKEAPQRAVHVPRVVAFPGTQGCPQEVPLAVRS